MGNVKLYLPGQMGFSKAGSLDLSIFIITKLEHMGYKINEPFKECANHYDLEKINSMKAYDDRKNAFKIGNWKTGKKNVRMMSNSDVMAALLDGGHAVDDGTASEIGWYCAKQRGPIIALRTDFRLAENIGCLVNLQIEYFIKKSPGGRIYTDMNDWFAKLERVYKQLKK